jgi:hypothetical protein
MSGDVERMSTLSKCMHCFAVREDGARASGSTANTPASRRNSPIGTAASRECNARLRQVAATWIVIHCHHFLLLRKATRLPNMYRSIRSWRQCSSACACAHLSRSSLRKGHACSGTRHHITRPRDAPSRRRRGQKESEGLGSSSPHRSSMGAHSGATDTGIVGWGAEVLTTI